MSKKSFKDSARASVAAAFISNAQEVTHEVAQEVTHEVAQEVTQDVAQEVTQDTRQAVRTQGRKGKKKPRINMAFDPAIYEFIRAEAEKEDKSITQFVNDILATYMKEKQ